MDGQVRPLVRWVLGAQAVLTGIAVLGAAIFTTWGHALFVLLGGLLAASLGALFALRLFAVNAGADPKAALSALYRAVATKLLLAVIAFVLAARFVPDRFLPLLLGFCVATMSYWLALLRPWSTNKE